ncbi:serine/threonine protein kinase [Sorangium cellulosum]|uniref:Serine/threonine protein kinase n=2 Tax=Sorangium cellulosum TaxID=56 RepID=A0A4P2PXX9_SORCE|nr:serine/threonine protein kinase [Sorangium cellulosum]
MQPSLAMRNVRGGELSFTQRELLYETADTLLYRGYSDTDGVPVTIKVLKGEHLGPRRVAQLQHEFEITRHLQGEHVIRAYRLEKIPGGAALLLEDFGGVPLHELARSARLDLKARLRIASALAAALSAVHGKHVIHKDIKPQNVLVHPTTGQVKLTDFGISTWLSEETQAAQRPDLLEGTLAYMSPEQTGRMNRVIDYRTDLYSLGVTLYELFSGVLPFQATDPVDLMHSHIARIATPLHERSREIPRAVSDIVQKLMSKVAEERYQSGSGLKADLDACLSALEATGQIPPFELGARDVPSELRIPQRLYGRDAQMEELLAAFERARGGRCELLLIAGGAGVGKSALVSEVHKEVAQRGGHFIEGKFDQLSGTMPHAPVAEALRQRVRQLLTEPAEVLEQWKDKLLRTAGKNAQILVDLIPDLGLILGPQPEVPPLGPSEAQNRFNLLFQDFLRVITTAEHPVALFLDDLQWADPASLKLLHLVVTDPGGAYLLIIGAYRDQEAIAGKPITSWLGELRAAGVERRELTLAPLSLPDVRKLVADALSLREEQVEPLAEVVHATSQGNPFFLSQLLKELYAARLVSFDPEAGRWTWQLEPIKERWGATNVHDLLVDKMQRLPPAARRALSLAACVGHQFDLKTLSIVSEKPPAEVAADLWDALRDGLVVPLDPGYRLLHTQEGAVAEQALSVRYRFLHDRGQQAAYALIADERKEEVHLRIGRLIRAQVEGEPRDDDLFKVVNHENIGAALITDRAEQLELSRLNLAAGKRAKDAMAHTAAAGYFKVGMALLGDGGWEEDYALCFALHRERAECEWLSGGEADAEALIRALLSRARSRLERAEVYRLRILVHTMRGEFADVLRVGREGVALFGVELPEAPEAIHAALGAALAEIPVRLGGRPLEALAEAPWVGDADQLAALRLLAAMIPGAYTLDPTLLGLIAVTQVNISLRYGNSPAAACAYGVYCLMLAGGMGRYEEARRFQKVSLELCERPDVELQCKAYLVCGAPSHFFEPTRASVACLSKAYQSGLTTGDFSFAAYTSLNLATIMLASGYELASLKEELAGFLGFLQRTNDPLGAPVILVTRQMVACLEGKTNGRQSLSDAAFDDGAFLSGLGPAQDLPRCWYFVNRLALAVLYGDPAGALHFAERAQKHSASAMGLFLVNEIPFYASLALLARCATATEEERAHYLATAAEHRAKFAGWAEHAPENYAHKERLIGAELARVLGKDAEAAELYDQAIEGAREGRFVHHEALASELCARFYLAKGRERIARWHLIDAYRAYRRWGATAKAEHLAEEHGRLLEGVVAGDSDEIRVVASTVTRRGTTESFDVATVVRAMQAVASENVLDRLLDRLMRSLIANAGAQRGALILEREGKLVIVASMRVDPDVVETGLSIPALESKEIATSVVQLVERTREPVVLNDARRDTRFASDPYIAARQPRSILCLAMTHQGRSAGILYLENNVVQRAFTPGRVEVCGLLASQAAIALENALLIASIREGTEALQRSNEQLQRELELRAASEAERALLEQEIVRRQTPIIPITDDVLVMPIVGAMDGARAQQVLETALTGFSARQAKAVILDITGVARVDAAVAEALIKIVKALQLLGAKAVLSGVRPEVARALVEQDVHLGSIVTMGTLQSSIAYALGQNGLRGASGPRAGSSRFT